WLFGTYQHAGTARPQNFGTTEAVPANIVDQLMAPFMGRPDRAAPAAGPVDAPPQGPAEHN
ncbi:MAG: hypothetical protein ACRCUI_01325, partial [Polymorphobacter sp.]